MYAVLLDACVLVPNALCDTLLRLAERGFYRPLWSQRILDEVKQAILAVHPEIEEARVEGRIAALKGAFDDAMVVGWEQTCAGLDLPDPDDRHVLAAAIKGGAQSLLTFNLKDFPGPYLATTDIEVGPWSTRRGTARRCSTSRCPIPTSPRDAWGPDVDADRRLTPGGARECAQQCFTPLVRHRRSGTIPTQSRGPARP